METKQPLLSICIPTYNRASVLKDCLCSLVQADGFSDEVEVVISDNCSTDETQQIVKTFAEKNPNIRYYRNDCNVGADRNILIALERGTGIFLKLSNDYNLFKKNSISFILKVVRLHLQVKPVLYFHNHMDKGKTYETTSFDEFLCYEKLGIGWIGNYGYWKEDFLSFENKDAYTYTQFQQIDWLVRSFLKKRKIFCYNEPIFIIGGCRVKTGAYNFIEAHAKNFFIPLNTLYESNALSQTSIEETKKYALYFCTWIQIRSIFLNRKYFSFSTENGWEILKQQFGQYAWYKKTLLKGIVFALIAMPYERLSLFTKRAILNIRSFVLSKQ